MEKLELPKEIPAGLVFKLGISVLTHPMEVSKVLIQIGHEPVAPRATRTLFGNPALSLPSVFQYCGYIRRREGFTGLFRGITPRISSIALQSFTSAKFDQLVPPEAELSDEEAAKLTEEQKVERFVKATLRDMANKTACVIISQPLQVLTVRAIAEFVGGEHKYTEISQVGYYPV
jgi:carrier protein